MLALVVALSVSAEPLRWEPAVELPVSGVLVATWLTSEFALKKQLAPTSCRWCVTNDFDTAVRRAFNPTLAPSAEGVRPISSASDLVGLIALPVFMVGLDALFLHDQGAALINLPMDVVILLESAFSAMVLNQATKFAVGRARPFSVGATAEQLAEARDPADKDISFYSGHTSFTFSLATAAGMIANLRGFKGAPIVWIIGMSMAATTGLLRMAADKHWATDVLVGAAIGSAVGALIPWLHRSVSVGSARVQLTATGTGFALAGSW